jgi:iron-sulfur cluster assembly protein
MSNPIASIQITDAAAARVAAFVAGSPGAVGVRFGVRRTGCSGWAYTVDLADAVAPDDTVFEQHGVRVVVDAKSLPLVDGTEIDFARRGLNAEFVFRNPNVTGECGCGESFTTTAA